MDKYSNIDIDAMLKRIKENVDKQSESDESKDEPVKSESTAPNCSPEELVDKVIADMEKRGSHFKKSSDVSQYDISGFEIEEDSDDATEEVAEEINETPIDEEASTEKETLIEEETPIEEEAPIEEILVADEALEEESEEQENVEISDEPSFVDELLVEEAIEEDTKEGIDEIVDEIVEDTTDVFEELSVTTEEAAETIEEEFEETIEETVEEEIIDAVESVEEEIDSVENEIDELVLEPLPYEKFNVIAEEQITDNEELTPDFSNEPGDEEIIEIKAEPKKDEPHAEEIDKELLDSMPKVTSLFSKGRVAPYTSNSGNSSDDEDSNPYGSLDNVDMNLAMAMGSKESLENAYGYVSVSEARHNFVGDRRASGTNVILDNHGREYKSLDQNSEISDAYRREKKRIGKRVIFTAILFIFLIFCEMMYPTGTVADVSEFMTLQFRYNILSIILFAIAVIASGRKLFHGAIGFFTNRLNYYTVIGFVSLVNVVYDVLVISVFKDHDMLMFNSLAVLGLLVIIVGEYMQIKREISTFELVSNGKKKISLERVDITSETTKKESFLSSNEFVIENTSFVGRYFERSARVPEMYRTGHAFVMLTMLLSMFVAVTAVIITREFSDFVFVIELSSLLCVPVQIVFFGSYSYYITSKKLSRYDSAIIGETLTDEYVGSNTIYLDDVEVFGRHGVHVVNLEPFNNFNIIDINYYYLSVFSKISGPLKNAFGDVPENMKLSDKVELLNIYSNGFEAMVDEKNKVLVGKRDFIVSRGVNVGKSADDRYGEKGDVSIMYFAINGALCAKLYLKYTVTHHFEKFAEDMTENGSSVGVRTIDPNITEQMLSALRADSENSIKVIRPTLNELLPIARRSDSGIITEKNPHMIAKILAEGLKVKKVNFIMNILWSIYSVVGIIAVITFMLLGIFSHILPVYIIAYQALWFIGLVIFIKNKLRNGKSR